MRLALVALSALALVPGGMLGAQDVTPCTRSADGGAQQGVLLARVLDAASGTGVGGAVLTVLWRVTAVSDAGVVSSVPVERIARADSAGRVRFCGLPAGASLLTWAEVDEARSVPAEIVVPDADTLAFELRVPAAALRAASDAAGNVRSGATGDTARARARPDARVSGIVRAQNGDALAGARVRFALGGPEVRTDTSGRFALPVVGPGARQLDIIALGWAPERRWVSFQADRTTHVDVTLSARVRLLEEVRVSAPSAFARGFEERRRRGAGGYFMDHTRIAQNRTGSIMDVALGFPALRVSHDTQGRMLETLRRGASCPIAVYLDGSPIDQIQLDAMVTPDLLYGIEYYPGFASPPIQYTSYSRSNCGTMLLWTREHANRRDAK
jgi:hypothetical protein